MIDVQETAALIKAGVEQGRLEGLREAAELARDMHRRAVAFARHDAGQRRMASRIAQAVNNRLVAAGAEPVEL